MKMFIYSVYDKAIQAFLPPFYVRAKGEALRSFTEACNSGEHNFNKHSTDYQLMYLGEWDDSSGTFVSDIPQRIVGAYECIQDNPFTASNQADGTGVASPPKRIAM